MDAKTVVYVSIQHVLIKDQQKNCSSINSCSRYIFDHAFYGYSDIILRTDWPPTSCYISKHEMAESLSHPKSEDQSAFMARLTCECFAGSHSEHTDSDMKTFVKAKSAVARQPPLEISIAGMNVRGKRFHSHSSPTLIIVPPPHTFPFCSIATTLGCRCVYVCALLSIFMHCTRIRSRPGT